MSSFLKVVAASYLRYFLQFSQLSASRVATGKALLVSMPKYEVGQSRGVDTLIVRKQQEEDQQE